MYKSGAVSNTFVSGVDPLCDEQAAGLWLCSVEVSEGELVWREAKRVVANLAAPCPVGAEPTKHGLLLSAVNGRRG